LNRVQLKYSAIYTCNFFHLIILKKSVLLLLYSSSTGLFRLNLNQPNCM